MILDNQRPGDKVIQELWQQARRVEEARGPRTVSAAEPPAPAVAPEAKVEPAA